MTTMLRWALIALCVIVTIYFVIIMLVLLLWAPAFGQVYIGWLAALYGTLAASPYFTRWLFVTRARRGAWGLWLGAALLIPVTIFLLLAAFEFSFGRHNHVLFAFLFFCGPALLCLLSIGILARFALQRRFLTDSP